MKSACIHEVFKRFSDTLNKSQYQNNSDAEIPTVVGGMTVQQLANTSVP